MTSFDAAVMAKRDVIQEGVVAVQSARCGKVPLNFRLKTTVCRLQYFRSAAVQLSSLQVAIVKCTSWQWAFSGHSAVVGGGIRKVFLPGTSNQGSKKNLTISRRADERSLRPWRVQGQWGVFCARNRQSVALLLTQFMVNGLQATWHQRGIGGRKAGQGARRAPGRAGQSSG